MTGHMYFHFDLKAVNNSSLKSTELASCFLAVQRACPVNLTWLIHVDGAGFNEGMLKKTTKRGSETPTQRVQR